MARQAGDKEEEEGTPLDGGGLAGIFNTKVIERMTKTLQVRVEESLRSEADDVLREMGLDVPSAVRLFLTKVVQTRSIPFELTASLRVEQVGVDAATQEKMDEIGTVWSRKGKSREI